MRKGKEIKRKGNSNQLFSLKIHYVSLTTTTKSDRKKIYERSISWKGKRVKVIKFHLPMGTFLYIDKYFMLPGI